MLLNYYLITMLLKKTKQFLSSERDVNVNPIRPNLLKALKQKPFESLIYNFLIIPKYVYTLTSTKKKCHLYSDRRAGGVSNLPVKIFCAYFGHIYVFSEYYSYFIMLGV